MSKSNEEKSLAKVRIVHGVEIRKMPCGKYFEALQTLKDLPNDFIKELSNGEKNFKLSEMFTMENIMNLVTKLLIVFPSFTFKFLSKLTEIDIDTLENKLTPKEVIDIMKEFWEINELESFFEQMKPIIKKSLMLIGFKEQ